MLCFGIECIDLAAYLDDISALQDLDFFYEKARAYVESHLNERVRAQKDENKMRAYVVSTVAS